MWKSIAKIYLCSVSQQCLTLCDPLDCSLPGSSVHGIFQARILEWVAISFSRGSSQPRDWTHVSCISCIAGGFFTHWAIGEAQQDEKEAQEGRDICIHIMNSCCLQQKLTQHCKAIIMCTRSVMFDSYDPMDCSLPGSSVHGISQARILEWFAISFSREINYIPILPRKDLRSDKRIDSVWFQFL